MNEIEEAMRSSVSRRTLLTRIGAAGLGVSAVSLLAGCGSRGGGDIPIVNTNGTVTPTPTPSATATPRAVTTPRNDADILNFALNLEYLEAEFYLRAIGRTLSTSDIGTSPGTVTGGRTVTFTTTAIQQYANEIALDEENHVKFLRTALGSAAVARPNIDFTNAFNGLASLAGIGSSFDPFANETNFLLGSFIFEDVGVTAYSGAAPFIADSNTLEAAAGILAVEAYHSGEIRTLLYDLGASTAAVRTNANKISALRGSVGGGKDQGISQTGVNPIFTSTDENIAPTDANALAFARNTSEVLRIVYAGGRENGGFFPNGLNGYVQVAA